MLKTFLLDKRIVNLFECALEMLLLISYLEIEND